MKSKGYASSQQRICSFNFVLKFNTAWPLVGLTRCLRAHAQSLSGRRSDVLVILLCINEKLIVNYGMT